MLFFTNLPLKAALDFASALVAVGIALLAGRYAHAKSARYFMLSVLGAGEFAAAVGMEVMAPTLAEKIFWGKMQYLGLVLTAPGWFLFVSAYTQQAWMSRRVEASAWVVPIVTLSAVWTNEYHHLFWTDIRLQPYIETGFYAHGVFFWIFITYHYSLALLGFLLIYWQAIKIPQLYRNTALAFTVSAFPTTLSNFLYLIDPYRYPLSLMVTIPILVSAPILLWAFFTRRVFALRPVAYHLFFRQNADASLMVNADGFVVEANIRWLELTEQVLDAIIGKPIAELFTPPWDVLFRSISQKRYDETQRIHIQLETGEERLIAVKVLPIYEEQKQFIGLVVTGRDITEEEKARRQIEVQLTALESVANGVVITNPAGNVEWVNHAFTRITGYTLADVWSRDLCFLSAGEAMERTMAMVMQANRPWTGEVTSRRKNGEMFYEKRTITPLRNGHGEVQHLVITIQDITQEKESTLAVERNLRHMQLLYEVSQIAASQTDAEVLACSIGKRVHQALEVQAVYVAFYEREQNIITIPYWSIDGEDFSGPTLQFGDGITSYVVRTGEVLVIDRDFEQVAERYNVVHLPPDKIAKTWVGVPIVVMGDTIGVISIQDYEQEHAFTPEQIDILTTVASTMGVALANARLSAALQKRLDEMERISRALERANQRLQVQAVRDPLTNLFNRRYLGDHLEEIITIHRHGRRPLGMVMLDIDRFKRFNDTYGHDVGDALLKRLGEILLAHTRKEDIPCRYGGEEFLVVLANVTMEQAVRITEKWRALFAQTLLSAVPAQENPTLSAGIAVFPQHGENGDDLISLADQALYQAKQNGRNCVVVYDSLWPGNGTRSHPASDVSRTP